MRATLDSARVPRMENVDRYIDEGCTPGGTDRHFDSYGQKITALTNPPRALLCDPQTSGGLLVAVAQGELRRPSEYIQRYPPALGAIYARATARRREDRYPDAKAMQEDLLEFQVSQRMMITA